eukprot:g12974.t1
MVASGKAATATASELSSTSRRRASKDVSRTTRRGSGSPKRRDPGTAVMSHGATMTTATVNERRRSSSGGNGGAGYSLASTTKPSSTSYAASSTSTAAAISAVEGGGVGGGRRGSTANIGEQSRRAIRDAVRAHAPKEEGGFLRVDEYAVHLYAKYGERGGTLSKKAFAQVVAEVLGDDGMATAELEHAFDWFQKASGGQLFDFMAEPNRGDSASARGLCEVVDEWLKVDIAEPEALSLLHMMDLDRDGAVSVDDFMGFMGPQGEEIVEATSLAARLGSAIVDIEVSTSKEQERELETNGYKVVDANVNAGTMGPPIHVWYRRLKHGGAGMRLKPLVDVVVDHRNVNSALVVDGYQCIDRSLSKGTPLGASNYLWVRRAMNEEEEARDAIVDLAVTTGKAKDRTSDIHTPPARGFVNVQGNLNKRTFGKDIFLWYRPIKSRQPNAFTGTQAFRVASTLTEEKRKIEMRKNVRRQIRQYVSPSEASEQATGPVDYAAIFNKHDAKGKGLLSLTQLRHLLKDVGLNVETKDLKLLFGRIDHDATNNVSRDEFLSFVALTEDELDEVCDRLRRKFGAGIFSAAGTSRKEQIKGLRRRFAQVDEDGTGVLTREQFCDMLTGVGIYLTAHEQERVKERFDANGDGRIDLLNFLNFFLSRDRKERRRAARVTRALEAMREDALHKQVDKIKKQTIGHVDSGTAWRDLKKHHVRAYRKAFPNYLTVDDIGQALERLNIRRVRHCQHRKVFQETVALGGTTAAAAFGATLGAGGGAQGLKLNATGGLGGSEMYSPSRTLGGGRARSTVGSPSRLGRTAAGLVVGESSALLTNAPMASAGGMWDGDAEDPTLREDFTKQLEALVKAIRPDDQDFTTIEHIRDGLAGSGHGGSKLDRDGIHETEWAHLAQLVGADEAEHNVVDAHAFLEGLCGECLEEHESTKSVTLEDIAHTEEEALNLVCEDLVNMIHEEARVLDDEDPGNRPGHDDIFGDDVGPSGVAGEKLDYSKPFRLFDEQGLGVIPVDQFRVMLYRLHVNSLLRERQVVALIDRFDVGRKGEVTLEDFIAFATKKTWGQEESTDPFDALLAATANDAMLNNAAGEGAVKGETGSASRDECSDSDTEDARFRGLRVTGSKRGDALAVLIMSQLRKSFPNKPQEAKQELSEGLRALDHKGENRLPASTVVTALKRMGIELLKKPKEVEMALRVFEVEDTDPPPAGSGGRGVDFSLLINGVGRAWRAEDLHHKQHSLTGNPRLDAKVVRLQREFRSISTTKSTNPSTGAITYSYKMGKVFRKLDVDGDGTVSSLEFKRGLRKLRIGDYLAEKDVRRIFRSFDRGLSGSVDYHEFCDFLLHGAVLGGKSKTPFKRHHHRRPHTTNGGGGYGFLSSGRKRSRRKGRRYRRSAGSDNGSCFGAYHSGGWGSGSGSDSSGSTSSCSSSSEDAGRNGGYYYGYDSGSGDGLFEPPPDPIMDAAKLAMQTFAPSEERQQRVRDYFRGKDKNASGKVSESRFHQFLIRSGVETDLGGDGACGLIERMDPRATGYIRYNKFLDLVFDPPAAAPTAPPAGAGEQKDVDKNPKVEDMDPVLHRIQEAILQSLSRNRPYHGMFRLSDDTGSGLVTPDVFRHTLNMLGSRLTQDEAQMVADRLAARPDGLVDYEELYRLLLKTPPPQHLCKRPAVTPYAGGGALFWPPPAVLPSTVFAAGILGPGVDGADRGDPVLEEVASRVRQRVLEKTQLWGPSFSLSRQFEFHDPRNRGMVTVEDFLSVMEQLGVYLSCQETEHLRRLFDRYGDGAIDYSDFCQRIMFDRQGMEALASKINARFSELRRRGVDIRSAFDMYDLSKTGFVTRRDFREAMRKLQVPVTEHQLQSLCSRFGRLGDPDSVSYEDLFFFAHSAMPDLSTTSGGRAAVDGNGYDGIRGAGSGPILARDNVQRWYNGVASGEEQRLFDSIYGRLRSFKHQQDVGLKRATPPDIVKRGKVDAQVLSLPPEAVIPSPRGRCVSSSPQSPGRMARRSRPDSPARTGPRIWGCHTPLSRKGSLSISRGMSGHGCWMCPVCFFVENASSSKLCEICTAPNPGQQDSQVLQQCSNCTFANPELSVECQMCGEPLPYGRARRKQSHQQARSKGKPSGWDTGGQSDGEDGGGAIRSNRRHIGSRRGNARKQRSRYSRGHLSSDEYESAGAQPPWVVDSSVQAQALAASVNCSGGSFEVEWRGSVVVNEPIYVGDGTVVAVTGADTGAVIDGNAATRLFTVVNAALSLSGVNVSNGASTVGGAIAASGSTLSFNRTNFVGNRATQHGGGVYVSDVSDVSCFEVSFIDNGAEVHGGGMLVAGRSVVSCGASWVANAAGHYGGALSVDDESTVFWDDGAVFVSNTAGRYGGALDASNGSRVSWSASTWFESNVAELGDGAVVVVASSLSWIGSTVFASNSAVAFHGGALHVEAGSIVSWDGDTAYVNNVAVAEDGGSGALFVNGSLVAWTGATSYVGNEAGSGGGALYLESSSVSWGGESTTTTTTTITTTTVFDRNRSGRFGGGVFADLNSHISCDDDAASTLSGNSAREYGGAILLNSGSSVSFSGNSSFDGNSATGYPGAGGGAIYVRSSNATWKGLMSFTGNEANSSGGAICAAFAVVGAISTTFHNNSGVLGGGGLVITGSSEVSWSGDTEYTGNRALSGGAVLVHEGSSVGWTGATTFSSNAAGADGGAVGSRESGLLQSSDSTLTINGSTSFSNNTAGANGGAVALLGGLSLDVGSAVDVVFSGNHADVAGGAVFVSGTGVGPTFSNLSFVSNSAQAGGAVSMMASGNLKDITDIAPPSPTIFDRCRFIDNTATATGGAVESASGHDAFVGSVFQGNMAGTSGGALRLAGTASVGNCSFEENISNDGGGAALSNIGVISKMENASFRGNVFACPPGMFLGFNATGDPYEVACDGCQKACDGCSFEEPPLVPMCRDAMEHAFSGGIPKGLP